MLNFKNDSVTAQQMHANNQMDVSLGPQQQLYQIENFHTFNGEQSQASSQQPVSSSHHQLRDSTDFAAVHQAASSPNESHSYAEAPGNARPPPTSLTSDHLHQGAPNRPQLQAAASAAYGPQYNNVSGSIQNESSIIRNFYSHKTRITR